MMERPDSMSSKRLGWLVHFLSPVHHISVLHQDLNVQFSLHLAEAEKLFVAFFSPVNLDNLGG